MIDEKYMEKAIEMVRKEAEKVPIEELDASWYALKIILAKVLEIEDEIKKIHRRMQYESGIGDFW